MSNKTIDWCRRFLSVSAILIIGVVIYIVFIQENSVTRIYHNQTVIDSLQMEIARCNDTLAKYKELNRRLDCGDGLTRMSMCSNKSFPAVVMPNRQYENLTNKFEI